jgi:hypothetical protein
MSLNQNAVTRRRFVQATAASSLALTGFGRSGFAQVAKPNIVFILADDLGYADVSCYGQRDYTTPNVDRLAIEGVKFMQGYLEEPINDATPKLKSNIQVSVLPDSNKRSHGTSMLLIEKHIRG